MQAGKKLCFLFFLVVFSLSSFDPEMNTNSNTREPLVEVEFNAIVHLPFRTVPVHFRQMVVDENYGIDERSPFYSNTNQDIENIEDDGYLTPPTEVIFSEEE